MDTQVPSRAGVDEVVLSVARASVLSKCQAATAAVCARPAPRVGATLAGMLALLGLAVGCASVGGGLPEIARTAGHGPSAPPGAARDTRGAAVGAPDAEPPPIVLSCADPARCPRAVGMLVRREGAELHRCTVSLVAPDVVLTASHCLTLDQRAAGASCAGTWIGFAGSAGAPASWYPCDVVLDAIKVSDDEVLRPDAALLRLPASVPRRPLPVDFSPLAPGTIVSVAAIDPSPVYPSLHALEPRLCRVEAPDLAVRALGVSARRVGWLSGCPIVGGNSGSPVIDYQGRVRALVHGGTATTFAVGVTSALPPRWMQRLAALR